MALILSYLLVSLALLPLVSSQGIVFTEKKDGEMCQWSEGTHPNGKTASPEDCANSCVNVKKYENTQWIAYSIVGKGLCFCYEQCKEFTSVGFAPWYTSYKIAFVPRKCEIYYPIWKRYLRECRRRYIRPKTCDDARTPIIEKQVKECDDKERYTVTYDLKSTEKNLCDLKDKQEKCVTKETNKQWCEKNYSKEKMAKAVEECNMATRKAEVVKIQIFVEYEKEDGYGSSAKLVTKKLPLNVESIDKVQYVEEKIRDHEPLMKNMELSFENTRLKYDKILADYNIHNGDTITLKELGNKRSLISSLLRQQKEDKCKSARENYYWTELHSDRANKEGELSRWNCGTIESFNESKFCVDERAVYFDASWTKPGKLKEDGCSLQFTFDDGEYCKRERQNFKDINEYAFQYTGCTSPKIWNAEDHEAEFQNSDYCKEKRKQFKDGKLFERTFKATTCSAPKIWNLSEDVDTFATVACFGILAAFGIGIFVFGKKMITPSPVNDNYEQIIDSNP